MEAPYEQDQSRWPWTVSDLRPFAFVRLGGAMTAEDIGFVFARLVDYNHIEGADVAALQAGLIAAESLILPGGLQASLGACEINPSCCCGLEGWREWQRFLDGGPPPWLGHGPSPWLETSGDVVRVWSDGDRAAATDAFSIDFARPRLQAELDRAARELHAFLDRSTAWANSVGFSDVAALRGKLDECFHISKVG